MCNLQHYIYYRTRSVTLAQDYDWMAEQMTMVLRELDWGNVLFPVSFLLHISK